MNVDPVLTTRIRHQQPRHNRAREADEGASAEPAQMSLRVCMLVIKYQLKLAIPAEMALAQRGRRTHFTERIHRRLRTRSFVNRLAPTA